MSTADNSEKAAATGRPFQPGQSGNPGGRPKGLAAVARDIVGEDGKALVTFWGRIMTGQERGFSSKDRIEASKLLAERGWGKAPAYAPMEGGDPLALGEVEKEIGRIMDELAARREAKAAGEPTPRIVEDESPPGAATA